MRGLLKYLPFFALALTLCVPAFAFADAEPVALTTIAGFDAKAWVPIVATALGALVTVALGVRFGMMLVNKAYGMLARIR